jgi:DNA-binding SARP family transcriptional activator
MSTSGPRLMLRLLGAPEVRVAGSPLALNNQKARALLFYLAATGQPHTRDHLATLLWSESPAPEARHSLRSALYRLRQALRGGEAEGALSEDHDLLSLQLAGPEACDVTRFRHLLSEGGERALAEAVTWYRGPLLQGFTLAEAPLFEEWQRFEEARLNRAYADALEQLTAWAEARQAWGEAIGYAQHSVEVDPLAEDAQRQLIRLYGRSGATAQALRQYQDFEARLRRELGLAPSPETQALYHDIRRQQAIESAPPSPTHKTPPLPFVGREELLARLMAISQDPVAGRGATVLLQGEGGIGKSRLLDELAGKLAAASPGWVVRRGVCSPFDDLLSYGAFVEALHDLADLSAETTRQVVSTEAAPDARGRFFWRVLQTLRDLSRSAPLLLAIDDLQWANSSTLNLFGFLAMRLGHLPVMLVGTAQRAETIPALQRLITLGRRRGELHFFSLKPLSLEAVTDLLHASGLSPASVETLAEWLHAQSGGSPFILAEILAQLRAEAILTPLGEGWRLDTTRWLRWRTTFHLPETTHDLVAWRLANLAPEARRLLDVLAVAGQPLPFALLHDFPGLQADQLVSALDDLAARGLLLETPDESLALPHHLLRETLLHHLSNLRRRALHRQLAEALEARPALPADFPRRQIALHAVAGEDVDRARRYGLQALTDLHTPHSAGAETVDFLQHLHDLLVPTASPDEMLRLAQALGRLHQSLGHLDSAAHWHQQALNIARQADDRLAQAEAHFEMSELALVSNDYQAAASTAQAGLEIVKDEGRLARLKDGNDALHPSPPTLQPLTGRGHRLLGAALAMEGNDLPTAEAHLRHAAEAQRLAGHQGDLCATLFELGNVAAQRGQLARALEFYEEAARAAETGGVHYFLALARNNFAYHSLLLGQPAAAQLAASQGLKLAEAYGMMGALLHLYSTQGEIYLYQGDWAAASEVLQRGLALADELGNLERQAGYRAGLALAARGQKDFERATARLEEALALIADQGYWHLRTRIQLWLAETLWGLGRTAAAWPHLEEALSTARAHNRALLLVQGERLRACLLAEGGDWPAASALFTQTVERADALGFALEAARSQAAWGQASLRHSPTPADGRRLLAEARATLAAHDARADLAVIRDP